VFSQEGYDAVTERNHNPKSVVLAYHSSGKVYPRPNTLFFSYFTGIVITDGTAT
jgi:hypothetical protein